MGIIWGFEKSIFSVYNFTSNPDMRISIKRKETKTLN